MAGSVNKVILIGNICQDVDIRTMQSGDKVCNLNIATNEKWKDKTTGERKEKSEFHRVVIFNQGIIKVCQDYLSKGSKVYIEGQLETRSWEKDGQKKYTTEIVLRPFRGELTMLDGKNTDTNGSGYQNEAYNESKSDYTDDEIPF